MSCLLQDLGVCAATNPLVYEILRTMIPSKTQCDSFLMLVNAELLAMALHKPRETGLQPLLGAWKQKSADVALDLLAGFKRQGTAYDCCTNTSQQTCCQKELYNTPARSCTHPLQGSQCLTNLKDVFGIQQDNSPDATRFQISRHLDLQQHLPPAQLLLYLVCHDCLLTRCYTLSDFGPIVGTQES